MTQPQRPSKPRTLGKQKRQLAACDEKSPPLNPLIERTALGPVYFSAVPNGIVDRHSCKLAGALSSGAQHVIGCFKTGRKNAAVKG